MKLMNEMPAEGSTDGMVAEPTSLLDTASEAATTTEQTSGPAVERPEWLLDKYVTEDRELSDAIAEQAKAYAEAQKRLGGFTGAPEGDYEFTMPEGVEGEFDPELESFKEFTNIARKYNMSNEAAQEFLNIYVREQQALLEQQQIDFNSEKAALGPKADERLGAIQQWASANLAPEDMQAFSSLVTTADQVQVLEKLIAKTRNSPVPKTNQVESPVTGYSEYQFQQDVNSERYRNDATFRAQVRKKAAALFPG